MFKKINTWELVRDANADNTVCIGVCCKKLADAKGFRWVVGAAPRATPTSSRASSATARSTAFATSKLYSFSFYL